MYRFDTGSPSALSLSPFRKSTQRQRIIKHDHAENQVLAGEPTRLGLHDNRPRQQEAGRPEKKPERRQKTKLSGFGCTFSMRLIPSRDLNT